MNASASSLALMCLVTSGLLDLVFKLYTARRQSIGLLIFGTGCVWLLLHSTLLYTTRIPFSVSPATWQFGLLAALAVTVSNIVLLECLRRMPISSASTIYRLNTIPLVMMAVAFLGEQLSPLRGAGILAGLVTVLLLYRSTDNKHTAVGLYTALIIIAACVRALYGLFTKAGIANGADANTMMLLAACGWIVGGLCYARFREGTLRICAVAAGFMLIAGTLVFGVVWLLTTALTLGDASMVIPIANMGFVAAFGFSLLWRLEALTLRKTLAVLSAITSVALLTSAA